MRAPESTPARAPQDVGADDERAGGVPPSGRGSRRRPRDPQRDGIGQDRRHEPAARPAHDPRGGGDHEESRRAVRPLGAAARPAGETRPLPARAGADGGHHRREILACPVLPVQDERAAGPGVGEHAVDAQLLRRRRARGLGQGRVQERGALGAQRRLPAAAPRAGRGQHEPQGRGKGGQRGRPCARRRWSGQWCQWGHGPSVGARARRVRDSPRGAAVGRRRAPCGSPRRRDPGPGHAETPAPGTPAHRDPGLGLGRRLRSPWGAGRGSTSMCKARAPGSSGLIQ